MTLQHHRKRKSYLTVTRRTSTLSDISLPDSNLTDSVSQSNEWKIFNFNHHHNSTELPSALITRQKTPSKLGK